MCGLAGIYHGDSASVDLDALLRMRDAMLSRGPDSAGYWVDPKGGIGLAHRRLSILDLSDLGAQPMGSPDGRYQIVFNGEIYNHLELRDWCEARGSRFIGKSDTETLLHLYAIQGGAMLSRLRGMFAFALWDSFERILLLVRDPLGIKPLYYSQRGNEISFSSQVKSLRAGAYGNGIDAAGLVSFLLWGYVLDPHTIEAGISSLPAGHALSLGRGGKSRLWQYRDALAPLRQHEKVEADLLPVLSESVQYHLISDVPVGIFLSAGLDSSVITLLANTIRQKPELHAVTLGFSEYEGTYNDEIPGAESVADRCGIAHHIVKVTQQDFKDVREDILSSMDQPSIDGINTWMVSRAAAQQGLKVAISGVGGDELFGSYPSYDQIPRMVAALRFLPSWLGIPSREVLRNVLPKEISPKYAGIFEWGRDLPGAYFLRRALFMPWELPCIIDAEIAREGYKALSLRDSLQTIINGISNPFDQVMALEISIYMRNCLLRDADWAGMAHSLEIRTPLVDAELLSKVIGLRSFAKQPLTKTDLRRELSERNLLDKDVLFRRKTGFNVPVRQWLLGDTKEADAERGLRGWALAIMSGLGKSYTCTDMP